MSASVQMDVAGFVQMILVFQASVVLTKVKKRTNIR
jgi:hypothetical protein